MSSLSWRRLVAFALRLVIVLVFWRPELPVQAEAGGQPRFFLLNERHLELAKQAIAAGDTVLNTEYHRLLINADAALLKGPFSVLDSPEVAPSGDPHDFLSYGFYAWPNPDTPDGLPWIGRDGFPNPANVIDWTDFEALRSTTDDLSLAYYFTGDERYAEKAAELMRVWFLDEATRMNPRNEYADVIPGRSPGSFSVPGFANSMRFMLDTAGILEMSPAWSAADRAQMQAWVRDFTSWAETSEQGTTQRNEPSNHGTNYDFLFTLFGLYADDSSRAEDNYLRFIETRLPNQIDTDGSNPYELKRANNLLYSRFNLGRMLDLARLGTYRLDSIDLTEYATEDERSLRLAVDFLTPYLVGDLPWDRWPDGEFAREPGAYMELLRSAAVLFHDPSLLEQSNRLGYKALSYFNLRFPNAAVYETFIPGDANLDGQFNSKDLVSVFVSGLYEQDVDAGWSTGDWTGDWRFDSKDLVFALQSQQYDTGVSALAVPEPKSGAPLYIAVACWYFWTNASHINSKRKLRWNSD